MTVDRYEYYCPAQQKEIITDDAVVPEFGELRLSAHDRACLDLLKKEENAVLAARWIASHLSEDNLNQIAEALCWIFIGWKTYTIVTFINAIQGVGSITQSLLSRLVHVFTEHWDPWHIAELLLLLILSSRGSGCNNNSVFSGAILDRFPRSRGLEVVSYMKIILNQKASMALPYSGR